MVHRPMDLVLSPEDDELPAVTRIMILKEVSKADRLLFEYLMRVDRAELDDGLRIMDPKAPQLPAFDLLWWEIKGVIGVESDPGGHLWISKTRVLEELLRDPAKKNGRRHAR